MTQNKLSFESENLVVDYITLKFQDLDSLHQTRIANYLFKLGFNSYKESGNADNLYWGGTLLHFSGFNATRFYFFAKEQIIDWTIFSSAVLSRFDLYFEPNYKTADKTSAREFLQNCQKNIKQTNKNTSLEKNRKGWIFKIGNRKSNHSSDRISTNSKNLVSIPSLRRPVKFLILIICIWIGLKVNFDWYVHLSF